MKELQSCLLQRDNEISKENARAWTSIIEHPIPFIQGLSIGFLKLFSADILVTMLKKEKRRAAEAISRAAGAPARRPEDTLPPPAPITPIPAHPHVLDGSEQRTKELVRESLDNAPLLPFYNLSIYTSIFHLFFADLSHRLH